MRINPVKKKLVYHYSKFAPYGKVLTLTLDSGIKYNFRARTTDRTAIKEVWARDIYVKHGFDISENDVVFDLGGHIGTFAVLAGSRATKGKVVAFEPMKDNFEVLKSNVALNKLSNVSAENVAISNENGLRTFYLSSQEAGKKVGYGTGGHSFFPSKEREQKIEVNTVTLESMMEKYGVDKIDYLKLDTEGAEYDILFNTKNETLAKIQKIAMELHPFEDNTKEKMIDFLIDNGFENIVDKYGESEYMVYSTRKRS